MNAHLLLPLLALTGLSLAQQLSIDSFERPGPLKRNETTVVLDDIVPISESSSAVSSADEALSKDVPLPPPSGSTEKGVSVRVIDIIGGTTPIDPEQVKLLFPYAPKPLSNPPPGWKFESPENAPPFVTEVELAPEAKVSLNVRPHVLTPIADGAEVFSLVEPGFVAGEGYHQSGTVSASLAISIIDMDKNVQQLDAAIDRLQQLLASLPPTNLSTEESSLEPNPESPNSEKR